MFAVLIYYGSRPMCNEHLEGQRDDLSYITDKVGTVSAAGGAENLKAGVQTCFQHINPEGNVPVRPQTIF